MQGGAGVVVLAGFRVREGRENAVEVGVERFRKRGPTGGLLLHGGVGGADQDLGGGLRRLGGQFQRLPGFAAAGQFLGDLSQPGRGRAVEGEGDVKDGDGVAGLPLGAQLAGAAEVGLTEHVQMGGRRFGLVDLLGQVEGLLETPFADRPLRPVLQDRPGRRGRRAVFLLCQGESPRGRVRRGGGCESSPLFFTIQKGPRIHHGGRR